MRAHHGTSPRAIQRLTLRSMRATWRRAQSSSRVQLSISSPYCPAGRDRARRATTDQQIPSSPGFACALRELVQALRGASAGRASFF